jgi:hypothetical protein
LKRDDEKEVCNMVQNNSDIEDEDSGRKPKVCKNCGKGDGIKEIVFGYPSGDFDQEKYIPGGCCIGVFVPKWHCAHCSHEW